MFAFNLFVCTFYGLLSITQTLNSRFLFKTLQFNFFSVVFLIQKIFNISVNHMMGRKTLLNWRTILQVIPYSIVTCLSNILSSYCVTVMPLAAYMAFKKFVVLFVLVVCIAMQIPHNFNKTHYMCIAGIVIGGLMIGQRDIFKGQLIGYIASLAYTLFQAISLQFSQNLYQKHGIGPQDLIIANSIVSLPVYVFLILWQSETSRLVQYFESPIHPLFILAFIFGILLAFCSQYTANTISMKISPFEKASVSNIKDLVLTLISLYYFQDFALTWFSEIGIFFCLTASMIFSFTLIQKSEIEELQRQKHVLNSMEHMNGEHIESQAHSLKQTFDQQI